MCIYTFFSLSFKITFVRLLCRIKISIMITVNNPAHPFGSIGSTDIIFKFACFGSAANMGGFLISFKNAEPKKTGHKVSKLCP